MSSVVALKDVERELKRQMQALQGTAAGTFQRARMSNFVIFCDDLERSIVLNEQVPAISTVHPARTILLVGEPGPDRPVTARVTVRPLERGTGVGACAEMVTLHAGGSLVERLPFAVRALLIGDLPVNVLWSSHVPPPLAGVLMHDLADLAQQVIYDSLGWPDPARGMVATAGWLGQIERPGGRWRVASDLNWRRLKSWRRLLSQALGPASAPGAAETVSEVLVEHGPHASIQAWLLAAWLTRLLGATPKGGMVTPGVEMAWRFVCPRGDVTVRVRRREDGPPSVRRVRLASRPAAIVLTEETPQRLSMELEGMGAAARTIMVPASSPVDLIGRQLSDRERDPAFRDAMRVAEDMARGILPH
ncbi:MAG: glucose-6-phosphate dehydrogenase assembly protein OpcA [Gemmataceae bacterium]